MSVPGIIDQKSKNKNERNFDHGIRIACRI